MAETAAISTKNTSLSVEETRRSVKYHPSVWRDRFLTYTDHITEISGAEKEQLEDLKENVSKLVAQTPDNSTLKIELIDAIQRLGIGYHFEKEIDESLRQIHDNYQILSSKDENNVRVLALRFRLLRQQGYRVPCDVFNKLIDGEGDFKESLMNDIEGMLSLYEALNYGINGEEILDKSLQFFSSHLESLIPQMNTSLSKRVADALSLPISKTLKRVGAMKFMSFYQEDASHNEMLLDFAKLDFNIVQKMHQRELHHITRWWEDFDFANKLPFARDRVVECYFWSLAVYFEPKYETARRYLTKVIAMISILDDIYDVYGTLEELRRFTESVRRWDISAVDELHLPPYMGVFYEALLGVYAQMEDEVAEQGDSYRVEYSKKEMIRLAEAYMGEAEWCYSKYIPTMEEYMKVGAISSSYITITITCLVGMRDPIITQQDFDWITNMPPIMQSLTAIARLTDDLVGLGIEEKITAINCYMNEKGCTVMEALSEVSKVVKKVWTDTSEELMIEPKIASTPILERILNLSLILFIMYAGDDGYTNSNIATKHYIQSMFIDPI